ncbi:MAG: ferritin [Halothiobacillaceae bacterium]
MLKQEIIDKLNTQIGAEMYASNLYLQMSAWCETQGLAGAAAFFRKHVPEEIMHRDKFVDYLIECDAEVIVGPIEAPPTRFDSLVEVIHAAYGHEQKITGMINDIAELALAHNDFNTFNMLQYFIAEQREEEVLFRGIIDQIKLVAFKGETGEAMFHINNYLQRLADTHA